MIIKRWTEKPTLQNHTITLRQYEDGTFHYTISSNVRSGEQELTEAEAHEILLEGIFEYRLVLDAESNDMWMGVSYEDGKKVTEADLPHVQTDEEKAIRVRAWFIEIEQSKAVSYRTDITVERAEDGTPKEDADGCCTVYATVLGESEKAVHVKLATGQVLENYKGWLCWIPKSVIIEM